MTSGKVSNTSTVQGPGCSSGGRKRGRDSQTMSMSSGAISKKFKSAGSSLDSKTEEQEGMTEKEDAETQMTDYALEMSASTHGTRLHTVGVLLRDDKVSYWYIDASGVVRTSPESTLSLIFDFEKVAAIHVALSCCDIERLGMFPADVICPPADARGPVAFPPASLTGCTLDLTGSEDKTPFKVTLGKHLVNEYTLFGRRTMVYLARLTSIDTGGRVLAVKISQQVETRTSEVDLVELARDRGIREHLPEMLKAKDLWRLSQGIRKNFVFDESQKWEDRILRCIVLPYYIPLCERLRENPDSIKTMATQMLTCEFNIFLLTLGSGC